jgi:polysaccharide biosynthesis protein PslA
MFRSGSCQPERRRVRRSSSFFHSSSKRAFDVFVATASLFLLSPLILLVSLGIMIDSSGPALCRRKYYNSNNMEFEISEFRTTFANQNEKTLNRNLEEMRCWTRIGRLLRRSGMHKLPLLINVLQGAISIVGSHLFVHAPGHAYPPLDLHGVKPGLVSWADANNDLVATADAAKTIYRCIKCDRYYVENISLLFDIKILLNIILSKKALL